MKRLNENELEQAKDGIVFSTVVHRKDIVFKKKCHICNNLIPENDYDSHIKKM